MGRDAGKESRPRSLGEIVRVGWGCPPEEEEKDKCLALVIRAFPSYQEIRIINKSQVQSSKVGVGNWKQKSECLVVKEVALPHRRDGDRGTRV